MLKLKDIKSGYSTGTINSNFRAIEEYVNTFLLNRRLQNVHDDNHMKLT